MLWLAYTASDALPQQGLTKRPTMQICDNKGTLPCQCMTAVQRLEGVAASEKNEHGAASQRTKNL